MGWCSATNIFDRFVGYVLDSEKSDSEKYTDILFIIEVLEENDWDCQQDSLYWDNPLVKKAMKHSHPNWQVYDLNSLIRKTQTLLNEGLKPESMANETAALLEELIEVSKEIDAIRYKEPE